MQFRTRSLDLYKDSLLEQMVASEQGEVVSPESCWVEWLERRAPQTLDQYDHNSRKISLYSRDMDFFFNCPVQENTILKYLWA